ncbi:glycosyltransferase [Paeniglutamicibacter antarcticus]|uniref:Glycosyltransferase n=1 Tax=Arthrobacter terrae TaxID=2935737 RepID=A0A931CTS1_9MICC|nr:glycosyltransferase [Arthrobacter terrae]MBG0741274.1 glycosyltransferase [Arthrobacter terrae]
MNSPDFGARSPRVVAVVVSYNRRELLGKTLQGIAGGSLLPDVVVVVDNASTDGSAGSVRDTQLPYLVDLVEFSVNLGGAGGFTAGIERAVRKHSADLVWVMDDDTEPHRQSLSALVDAWQNYSPAPERRPALLASRVVWVDGRDHPMNTMGPRIGATREQKRLAQRVNAMPIRSASFVSAMMSGAAIREHGLPRADYFIWNDDFEFTTRLSRFADAIQVPASVVTHHTAKFGSSDVDPGPRFFYDVRNKLWTFSRSRSLAGWEKFLYSGATLRMWIRALARSGKRRVLLDGLVRGGRAALHAPRPNSEVFAGIYPIAELTAAGGPETRVQAAADHPPSAHGTPQAQLSQQPGAARADLPFSLLMPVYANDSAERFRRAFDSASWQQSVPPHEIVIVQDGPVGPELEGVLSGLSELTTIPVQRVILAEHAGLTAALSIGLTRCSYDVVARADADDVCLPHRFQRQLPLIAAGADLVGAGMQEIGGSESELLAVRTVPVGAAAIRRASAMRNPINHPTAVFRVSAVQRVGGYQHVPQAEDYWLWMRMLAAGATVENVNEPLVLYRVSAGSYERRGGLGIFRAELTLQSRLLAAGYISRLQYLRNIVVRGGYRFLPTPLRMGSYRNLVAPAARTAHGTQPTAHRED